MLNIIPLLMAFKGRFVLNMVHFAGKQGLSIDRMVGLTEHSLAELEDENCRLEAVVYNRLLEYIVSESGDVFFGLHAGEHLNLTTAGLISQITQTSETVLQALEQCCAFANLGCSSLPMTLHEEKEAYRVSIEPNKLWREQSETAMIHTAEGVITFMLRAFNNLTRMRHNPISIEVSWSQKEPSNEYERVWECPIRFSTEHICLYLKKSHVEEKVVTADYRLFRILVAHAEEKTARMLDKEGFASLVKQSVIGLVKPEFPAIQQVSSHLNVSVRTLQRKLALEGYTYKGLLDELRKELAISYLKRRYLGISDIAYLLNYAEVSAFTRSFKRWTGQSPGEYRTLEKGLI